MAVTPLAAAKRDLLVDMADIIRATAVEVFDAEPQGAPARSRWTVGEPAEFCCGAVTVILRRISPANPGAGSCEPWLWSSDWTVDVSRDCPPGLGSVYNILPSPAAERESDTLLLFDAASLYLQFAGLVQKAVTVRVRSSTFVAGCVAYRPGVITPYERGDCRGLRFDFTLGLMT